MADKLAEVISYLIGAGLMSYALILLKRKNAEQPHLKISGVSIKTFITLIYIGIAVDAVLILIILAQ